jgi:hypothetical protein
MKLIPIFTSTLLLGGAMLAAQPPLPIPPDDHSSSKHAGTRRMTGEVVSTDAAAKTITVRKLSRAHGYSKSDHPSPAGAASSGAAAKEVTLPVEAKAVDRLAFLRPGDTISLTCRADSSPSGCGPVTDIAESASSSDGR